MFANWYSKLWNWVYRARIRKHKEFIFTLTLMGFTTDDAPDKALQIYSLKIGDYVLLASSTKILNQFYITTCYASNLHEHKTHDDALAEIQRIIKDGGYTYGSHTT